MTARVLTSPAGLGSACDELRAQAHTIALVPTMGALHAGHLELVKEAARQASQVLVTIFVNPTQFGPTEDFQRYPRDLDGDCRKCEAAGASLIFAPNAHDMYLPGDATRVHVSGLTQYLCGPLRPGHFEGVATVVTKLFALVGRCSAIFGRKDYQQVKVIERLVADLMLPVRVLTHPTVREADGLAMSSRNAYLSAEERDRALAIPRSLSAALEQYRAGERNVGLLRGSAALALEHAGLRADYVSVAHPDTLEPLPEASQVEHEALLAIAAFAGKTRLIDNVVLGRDVPPLGR